jgi:hypothetical protein
MSGTEPIVSVQFSSGASADVRADLLSNLRLFLAETDQLRDRGS